MFNKLKIKYYQWVQSNCLEDIQYLRSLQGSHLLKEDALAIEEDIQELEGCFVEATCKIANIKMER